MTDAVTSATSTPRTTSQSSGVGVDYQSFLRLLVAEMKNQDPTKPMDSTQYVAQLAAFSQVEQSVKINNQLGQLLQASTLSQADALIGRTITSADGTQTGVVKEVRLVTGGAVAVLQNGGEVTIGAGVKIAAAS